MVVGGRGRGRGRGGGGEGLSSVLEEVVESGGEEG